MIENKVKPSLNNLSLVDANGDKLNFGHKEPYLITVEKDTKRIDDPVMIHKNGAIALVALLTKHFNL